MFEKKQKDLKREELRKKKKEDDEAKEACFFKPKINKKKEHQSLKTRYLSPGIIRNDILKEINVDQIDN
jgi:hypothetical protein